MRMILRNPYERKFEEGAKVDDEEVWSFLIMLIVGIAGFIGVFAWLIANK